MGTLSGRWVLPCSSALALLVALAPLEAWAQGSSGASVVGVVRDTSGAVLPGVSVEASSPALIEKVRTTITNGQGQFRIVELRPGTYTVSFTLPGFNVLRREGIELSPNFTATLNVELTLGAVSETISVTGQTPLVDTQNVAQQRVFSKELIDAVPTNKSMLGFVALMSSAVTPASSQDVGGTKGETSVRVSVYGGKPGDAKLLQDGMRYNSLIGTGTGRGMFVNPLGTQEVVIDIGAGGSAEMTTGGAQTNIIPRDGGNLFAGAFFTALTGSSLQADNLTDGLRAQGLRNVNGIKEIHDVNAMFGGPIIKDRLWFMTAHRHVGRENRIANLFGDANPNDFVHTDDTANPIDPPEQNRSHNIRLTAQLFKKHKVTFSYDWQRYYSEDLTGTLGGGALKAEANTTFCPQNRLYQATWTHPASNTLLFEGGTTFNYFGYGNWGSDLYLSDFDNCDVTGRYDNVSINDTGRGYTYNGKGFRNKVYSSVGNQRFTMSHVTGQHVMKVGLFVAESLQHQTYTLRAPQQVNGLPVSYTFLNGSPTQLTQFASPDLSDQRMRPDLGIFLQDQWKLPRLTLSAGLRYDYIRAYAPPLTQPAGLLTQERSYPGIDCVPCWHDLSPRLGVVYDPIGNGRTAFKASLGRYVGASTVEWASTFAPSEAVNSTTRPWQDGVNVYEPGDPRRGNFIPDCDLRSPLANGECGPMQNPAFGQSNITTRPDPNWIKGFGKRPYNWTASIEMDRELVAGKVAMNVGYHRRWFGNFTVTDNLLVTPADYDPFCVTAPSDARLPSDISGQQICGFYDIKPALFGATTNNLVTLASNYGKQSEIYNGADISVSARLRRGTMLSVGYNVGNSIQTNVVAGGAVSSATNNCFVVDSPQSLYQCDINPPYQSRIKASGSYELPWAIQVAAVYQNLPGPNYGASVGFTNAQIQPSLGRALAGTQARTIQLLTPFSSFVDNRINQLDLRTTKLLRFGRRRIQANFDLYNLFNSSPVLATVNTFTQNVNTNRWLQPTQILDGRLVKFSGQIDF
jgi:hypothetical protein